MRIRTIKPGFFKNDVLAELPPLTRLLFQGLWCLADGCGRLEDRPKKIKAEILPYDEWDCERSLASLAAAGFIIRYEVGGQRLIQVVNFEKHQRITGKEAEMESVYPAATGETQKSTPSSPGESYADSQDELGETSGKQPGNNRETTLKHEGISHAFPNVQERKGREREKERELYEDHSPNPREPSLSARESSCNPREPSANAREELPSEPRDAKPGVPAKPPHTPPEAGVATTTTRFRKPTLDEVKAYCRERGNGVSAERFHAYYEANGWRVGKNPMKNWQAAVRTWEGKDGGGGGQAVAGEFTAEELAMARKMGAVL